MRRTISMILALVFMLACLPVGVLAATLEETGWTAYQNDFSGWTLEDGRITDNYDVAVSSWLKKTCLDDISNFVIDVDITGSSTSSPYITVLNNVIELNGDGGNGDQVYVKVADQGKEWMNAAGTRVHVKVLRVGGGDLQIKLTGEGNSESILCTAAVRSKSDALEIGIYRGTIVMENLTVGVPDENDLAEFEVEKVGPPDPAAYNYNVVDVDIDKPFEFKGNGDWNGETAWTTGKNATEGMWLQSDSADGPTAGAAYTVEKLSGNWLVNCAVAPAPSADEGVSVSWLRLMKADKTDLVKLTVTYTEGSGSVKFLWQEKRAGKWAALWESDSTAVEDTVFNLRIDKTSDRELALVILGDKGYTASAAVELTDNVMNSISFVGLLTEGCAVRFTNFRIGTTPTERDYAALAKETYENLMKNFLDPEKKRLKAVRNGFVDGAVTNTGKTVSVADAGEVWETTVMLMALDTYAQTLDSGSGEYRDVAEIIVNTVDMLLNQYPEGRITKAAVAPNYAMDDTGWTTMCLLLGYHYNKVLGRSERSDLCCKYAKALFNSAYETFYNADLGGLCYTTKKSALDLYAATLALAGYYINRIEADEQLYSRFQDIYNGLETLLRRPDGLYWMGVDQNGTGSASNPYGIREGGSCTYIGANMAMAVLNMLMGNEDKAYETVLGIARFETYANGAFMNDRDAWNNTFFLGMFVREVMGKGVADGHIDRTLYATVTMILENACFDDGYYGASWSGPKEPSSAGYPSQGDYSTEGRNYWGVQYNNNGLHIGSTPNQIMTSATTAHVLLAAALNQKYDNTAAEVTDLHVEGQNIWPAFNPGITEYSLQGALKDTVTIHLNACSNAAVTVNGKALTGGTVTSRGGMLEIVVTSGDGQATTTYRLDLGEGLPAEIDPVVAVCVAIVAACGMIIAVVLISGKRKSGRREEPPVK